jgi:succinate dehydrogenase/fumarate reductase cytochrome b subunit
MLRGVGSIAAAAGCLFFRNSPSTVVIIYCLGLIYNGVIHIINGFRTNDIIAIQ